VCHKTGSKARQCCSGRSLANIVPTCGWRRTAIGCAEIRVSDPRISRVRRHWPLCPDMSATAIDLARPGAKQSGRGPARWFTGRPLEVSAVSGFGSRFQDPVATVFGIVLMAIGGGLVVTGVANLGRNLTPLPFPKEGGELVQTGAYSLVRHPVYSGVIAMAVGWACAVRGPLTMAYAVLLFLLFDAKSRREERWLETKFPSYAEYRKRVRRLIPFVY
jgi:Phospholipid methyltransferase